jgi:hypothetical protein
MTFLKQLSHSLEGNKGDCIGKNNYPILSVMRRSLLIIPSTQLTQVWDLVYFRLMILSHHLYSSENLFSNI